ncbi:MAG: rane protein [Bacteroidetes bacterium]|nr:rane protein [Bacteroidota bacterium]
MSNIVIHAIYDDEEPLLANAKQIRSQGFRIKDAFTPFPVHGLDAAIGLPRTRIAICAFIYGLTGASLATLMMWYMMVGDWPTDVGGKPSFSYYMNVPAFIPITFESTVLCAAHGMAITFFLRSWLVPGAKAKNPDPRTTDDKFMMVIETKEENRATIEGLLKSGGASEIHYK